MGPVCEISTVCTVFDAWVFTDDILLLFLPSSDSKCSLWDKGEECVRYILAKKEMASKGTLPCGSLCDRWVRLAGGVCRVHHITVAIQNNVLL